MTDERKVENTVEHREQGHRKPVAESGASSGDAPVADGRDHVVSTDVERIKKLCDVHSMRIPELQDEVLRLRAMRERLEEWARQLEAGGSSGVGPFIAAELRNRMRGITSPARTGG